MNRPILRFLAALLGVCLGWAIFALLTPQGAWL